MGTDGSVVVAYSEVVGHFLLSGDCNLLQILDENAIVW